VAVSALPRLEHVRRRADRSRQRSDRGGSIEINHKGH
jgi:hypothetical protein